MSEWKTNYADITVNKGRKSSKAKKARYIQYPIVLLTILITENAADNQSIVKLLKIEVAKMCENYNDLAIGGAVGLHDPAGFVAESFENLIVVAVLGERVVPVEAEAREYFGGDGSPPPLPALVVLPLLPRRRPRPPGHASLSLSPPPPL